MTDNQSQQTPRAFVCAFYADPEDPFLSFEPIQWGTNIPLYTAPQQRKPLTDEQVRKVARLFSDRMAVMCNVEAEDHWKYHGEEVVLDVQFVLNAAHGIKE